MAPLLEVMSPTSEEALHVRQDHAKCPWGNQHTCTHWKILLMLHSPYETPENPLQAKALPISSSC